jgi:hypothetical protein
VRWLEHERADELTRELPPVAVEARFGERMTGEKQGSLSETEPIEIKLPSGTLRLHGRIDRVNWDPERSRFRVVDYETGRSYAEKPAELQGGRMLQLAPGLEWSVLCYLELETRRPDAGRPAGAGGRRLQGQDHAADPVQGRPRLSGRRLPRRRWLEGSPAAACAFAQIAKRGPGVKS